MQNFVYLYPTALPLSYLPVAFQIIFKVCKFNCNKRSFLIFGKKRDSAVFCVLLGLTLNSVRRIIIKDLLNVTQSW